MDAFSALAQQVQSAHANLIGWHSKINDGKSFQPIIKAEWDRAFDKREALKTKLCRMDRERFAEMFPNEPNDR